MWTEASWQPVVIKTPFHKKKFLHLAPLHLFPAIPCFPPSPNFRGVFTSSIAAWLLTLPNMCFSDLITKHNPLTHLTPGRTAGRFLPEGLFSLYLQSSPGPFKHYLSVPPQPPSHGSFSPESCLHTFSFSFSLCSLPRISHPFSRLSQHWTLTSEPTHSVQTSFLLCSPVSLATGIPQSLQT